MSTPEERFWRYVERAGEDECWPWTGARDSDGYGHFRVSVRRQTKASIYSWELAHPGEERNGREIHHSCHTRYCVNPAHLIATSKRKNLLNRPRWASNIPMFEQIDEIAAGAPLLTVTLTERHSWFVVKAAADRHMTPEQFLARALDSYMVSRQKQCDLPEKGKRT